MVNLAVDISRQEPEIQQRFASALREFLAISDAEMSSAAWDENTTAFATLFGTMLMAKAVRHADKSLADAITKAGLKRFEDVQ